MRPPGRPAQVLQAARRPWSKGAPPVLAARQPRKPPFPRCAVVSPAGYLSLLAHGDAIDAADLVIRVGSGPVGTEWIIAPAGWQGAGKGGEGGSAVVSPHARRWGKGAGGRKSEHPAGAALPKRTQ